MPVVIGKNGEEIIVGDMDYEKAIIHRWYTAHSKKGFIQILTRLNGKRVSFSTVVFCISKSL